MKWPLFVDRSSQKINQRFVSTWPQIWSNSVEISANCTITTQFILFILAIGLAIATIFGQVFELKSGESGDFNEYFNVLNNDFKLDVECDFCDVLSSVTNTSNEISTTADTPASGFNFCPTGVGLAKFDNVRYDLCAVLSAPATVALVTTIENEKKSVPNGPHTHTNTTTYNSTSN